MRSKRRTITIVMAVFFLMGWVTRAMYLYLGVEWARGLPQIMAGLMFLTPVILSLPVVLEQSFRYPRGLTLLRTGMFVFLLLIVLLLLPLLLAGCTSIDAAQSTVTQARLYIPSSSPSIAETSKPSTPLIASTTIVPNSGTPRFTQPPPNITNVPPTHTLSPTLSPAEEEAYWIGLISSNSTCELPCWWGISPGESLEEDLLVLYKPWGLSNWYPWPTSDVLKTQEYPLHVNQYGILNLSLTAYTQYGIVQRIDILADNLDEFPDYSEAMERFSLHNVFLQHGKPSRVLLNIELPVEANAPQIYSLLVFYDQKGFLVIYTGEGWTNKNELIQICPSYRDVRFISFYLQSPDSNLSLDQLVDGGLGLLMLETTIERTTNLSLEDFYSSIVASNGHQVCFESPVDIWR